MAGAFDMSPDEFTKNNRNNSRGFNGDFRGRGRGRGFGPGPGPMRRPAERPPPRAMPYHSTKPLVVGDRGEEAGSGTKLYISNLDYGVSNEDMKVLFSDVGVLKAHSIHYDRSGKSKGTAEVVFARKMDAVAALERYNGVRLDGKPMNIELVGVNIAPPAPVYPNGQGVLGNPGNYFRRQERGRGWGWNHGGAGGGGRGGGGFGRGRGGNSRLNEGKLSVEDLDADLDKYRLEATQKQTN